MSIVRGMGAKVAAGGVLAMLALSGCSATEGPASVASPRSPTTTPLFANEQEALAAATKAYAAYEAAADRILANGGQGGDRIREFTSSALAESHLAAFNRARAKGWHSTGESKFDSVTLQGVDQSAPNGVAVVTVYLCSDVSAVDILDVNGTSVVSPSRAERLPFLVTFDVRSTDVHELVVGSTQIWNGGGIC